MNLAVIIISIIAVYLLSSFVVSKIFKKTKIKEGLAYIPIYNFIKLISIVDFKWYYIFGFIISPVNIWLWIYLNIKLGKKFNKSNGFIFGMIILPIIFYIILAFNKDKIDFKVDFDKKGFHLATTLIAMITVAFVSTISIPYIFNNITKGLDLAGGFEILYQVSSADKKEKLTKEDLESAYKTMMRRIDKLGVSEPEISIEGNDKIRVKLAGVTDPDEARNYITVTGELTFRDSSDNKLMDKDVISGAKLSQDDSGNPAILLNVKNKDLFYEQTEKISQTEDQLIVIWLDYDKAMGDSYKTADCGNFENENTVKCLSAATVRQGFSSNVIIQGNFTYEQAKSLVDLINSGSSNVKYKEISSKTVTSAFGENSLTKTEIAGVIGVSLIIVFLIIFYRFSGFISSLSVLIYSCMTLLIFYLIDGVLTLTGIAALLLGIGMAVDACVITNERIKEELRKGRSLKTAFINGNKNSFSSILDSNITTLIIALVLFAFGESSVKGFATMLIINLLMTMFIIIFINRSIMKLFVNTNYFEGKERAFVNFNKDKKERVRKFSFVKNFAKRLIIPIVVFILGIIVTIITGVNLGVDFKGGSDISIVSDNVLSQKNIEKDVNALGYTLSDITLTNNNKTVYVKVNEVLGKDKIKKTKHTFEEKYNAKTEISVVSNVVKRDLIRNTIIALIAAFLAIVVYISFRYKFSFAISALIALVHDILIMFSLFSIFNLEINTMLVVAILTIVGYSINNTIVIFDRIRENLGNSTKIKTKEELERIVDTSVSQTLFRSINTTITTLIPIVVLLLFGEKAIYEFNIAILFGLVAGFYSSVLLSSQIWYRIELKLLNPNSKKKNNNKKKKKKEVKELDELLVKGINS